jgi:prepilin-type N-terminal cleavage/methylation domain-containing protein
MINTRKGFSMAEALIVVVILGVLAALVIPRFTGHDERGLVAEAVGMLGAIRQAEAAYKLENAAYTATLTDLDLDIPVSTRFSYAVSAATGTATATRLPAEGTCSSTHFGNCTLTLKADGTWDQTVTSKHPLSPQ